MTIGYFIALEGADGSGKTTQSRLLATVLTDQGYDVVVTREPGGTRLGERIRELLLGADACAMLATTEALLFAAARAQHVHEVIRPALETGRIVVCDRFVDSSFAYQGGGRGLDMVGLRAVQSFAISGVEPDLRVFLDVPVEVGLRRRSAGVEPTNHLDDAGAAFHKRVRVMYRDLIEAKPADWLVVDARQDEETLGREIALAIGERLDAFRSKLP